MTTNTSALTTPLLRMHWHYPEWAAIAAASAGWLFLGAEAAQQPALLLSREHAIGSQGLAHAFIMSTAMMILLVVPRLHELAVGSLWRRRYRAIGVYLFGYLGAWSVAELGLMSAAHEIVARTGQLAAVAVTATLAYGVSATRYHARRIIRCHATRPLSISGWRADRDCAAEGVRMAARCLATTWALMLALATQHGLVVMAAGSVVMVLERRGVLRGRRLVAWTGVIGILAVVLTTTPQWFVDPALSLPHAH